MAFSNLARFDGIRYGYQEEGCANLSDPVSYTHLDVYKRQIEVRAVDANGFSFLLASLPTGVGLPEAKRVYSCLLYTSRCV